MHLQAIPKFIVIDDDHINNLLCREYILLAFPGADIQTFTSALEGLNHIQEQCDTRKFNETMLFLDINMPALSGWEILDTLVAFPAEMKQKLVVYILTSSVDLDDKMFAKNNPQVSGFIEKPLNIQELQNIFPGLIVHL